MKRICPADTIIDARTAAGILGISTYDFKKMNKDGDFPPYCYFGGEPRWIAGDFYTALAS